MNIKYFKNTSQLKKFLEWSLSVLCDNNEKLITKESYSKINVKFYWRKKFFNESNILNHNIKSAREVFEKIFGT